MTQPSIPEAAVVPSAGRHVSSEPLSQSSQPSADLPQSSAAPAGAAAQLISSAAAPPASSAAAGATGAEGGISEMAGPAPMDMDSIV